MTEQPFNVEMLPKPYIEIRNDGSSSFSWRWRIVDGDQEIGRGIAETRWGAKWAARRAWRRHRKHPNAERIPL